MGEPAAPPVPAAAAARTNGHNNLFTRIVRGCDDRQLDRLMSLRPAQRLIFKGMQKAFHPERAKDFTAEVQYELKGRTETVRWLVRVAEDIDQHASGFYALSTTCTHLGCTPNYLSAENKFKCPCHGSGFRTTGVNFEGPAPRPLERVRIVLAEDGQILVDKSRHFQRELGQWTDPEAFLKAS